jgi:hypothetical protein
MPSGELFELRLQVVAQQHGDLQTDPGLVAGGLQGGGAGFGLIPPALLITRIFCSPVAEQRREHFDKVAGEPGLGIHPCAGHDRQGDFRQVVEHQIIQAPACHQLGGGGAGVAPECAGASDANGRGHGDLRLRNLRQKCLEATKQALGL